MTSENKTLKFNPELVSLVLSREKYITWRLWDEKDLKEGDAVTFIRRPELTPFAVAKISSCIEKPLGELTEEDKKGNKQVGTNGEMYARYTQFYKKPVDSKTLVKILKFEILQKIS